MIKTNQLFDYVKIHAGSEAHKIEMALLTAMIVKHDMVGITHSLKERNSIYSTKEYLNYSSDYVFCDHDTMVLGNTDTLQLPLNLFVTEDLKLISYTIKLRPIFKGGYYVRINRKFSVTSADVGGAPIIWHTLNFPFSVSFSKPVVENYFSTWEFKFETAAMQMGQALATMSNVNSAAISLKETSGKLSHTFSKENLRDILASALGGATGKITQHIELALIVGSSAFAIRYYYLRNTSDLKFALFGAAVVTLMEGPNIVNSILTYFSPSDVPEMQAGIPDLSKGLESIFGSMFDLPKTTWQKLYMNVAAFDRFKCGLSSIVTFITNILNGVCDYVFSVRPISDTFVMSPFTTDEILNLCKEIDEFGVQVDAGELPANMTTYAKVLGLREACDKLLVNQKTNAAISVLSSRQKILKSLNDKLLFLRPGIAEERVEPVAILFQGAPGTTKSKWMNKLAAALSSEGESPYPRNFTTDYWEGYVSQSVVTLDDFGQQRDVAGKDRSEYAEFISMVTSAPYMLNMATLEEKGKTYFKAKYVIATSNMREFSLQSIVDSGAVVRRFEGNVFRVVPKDYLRSNGNRDSFCRKPDWSRFEMDENGVAQITPDDFEFIKVDLGSQREVARFSFEQLVSFVKKQQRRKEAIYEKEMEIRKIINIGIGPGKESDDELDDILMEIEDDHETKIILEQKGDNTSFGRLKVFYQDNFTRVCELYSSHHGVLVDAAKAFSVACEKLSSAVMRRICFGKAIFRDITEFLGINFVFIKLREKFFVDIGSIVKNYLTDNDPIFCKAHVWKITGAATVGIIGGLISMWESIDPELQGAYNKPIPSTSNVKKPIVPHNNAATLQAHDVSDENGKKVYGSLFGRNLYYIVGDEFKFCNYALFICDRWAILPLHWLAVQEKLVEETPDYGDSRFEFRMVSTNGDRRGYFVSVNYLIRNYVKDDKLKVKDIGLIKFPEDMRIHKDIREHFPADDELKLTYDYVRRFSYTLRRTKGTTDSICETTVSRADRIDNQYCTNDLGGNYYTTYSLKMCNDKGMCGMPYVVMNPKLQKGKILGIHLAGAGNISFCNPILRSYFDPFIVKPDIDPLEEKAAEFQSNDIHKAMFYELGLSEKVNSTVRSDLRKSCLFEEIADATTIPARLVPFNKNGILYDPEVLSLERFNRKQSFQVNVDVLNECIHSEIDWYNITNTSYSERIVYSIETAVLGAPDDIYFKSITRKTSPGYPYVLTRKGKGRFEIFGDKPEFDLETPKFISLRKEIELDIENMIKHHIVPEIYNIDCLKDETVSFKKFDSGMTRVFSAGDIKGLILYRMYFGNFVTAMLKDRFTNGSSIGINPYSAEWETLIKRFDAKGNARYNAGDFSAFDASQTSQILHSILQIVETFYGRSSGDDKTVRRLLWNRAINSIHISKGKIYKWDGGLPSGWYLTAIINSMYGRIAHKLCFYQALKIGSKAFWIFNKDVELSQHGDDSVFTVNPVYDDIFNEYTLTEYMANLGLKYTPENKEARSGEKRTKYDVNYLKRYWRFCDIAGRHVAPMKLDALLNQLNWTRKTNGDTITIEKANNVTRELALHGKDIFEKYVPQINAALQDKLQVGLSCTSYIQCLTDVLNYETDYFIESNMNFHQYKSSDADYSSMPDVSNCNNVNEAIFQSDDRVKPVSSDFVDQDDAVVDEQSIIAPLKLGRFGSAFKNSGNMDIIRFLSKPVVIESGNFTTIDGPTTFPQHFWSEPLANTMYANKMSGIYTINATLELRLQVNANPMQQGMYYLCYLPFGGVSNDNRQDEWYNAHRHSITQIVQLPHARILLGSETEATLSVPWRSCYNSYLYNPSSSRKSMPGAFFLYPATPLTLGAGGSTNVGYTLWANYSNIELGIVGSLQTDPTVVAQQKVNKILKGDVIAKEQEGKKISTVLYTMGTIANSFGRIPLLSALSSPLSYALSSAGMVADVLGFSKPNLIDPPVRSVRNNFPYMGVSDGVDAAEPLGLTRGNHVSMDPALLGTNVDEMSIAYLGSISNFVARALWSGSDVVGTRLFEADVSPMNSLHATIDATGVSVLNLGTLTWIGNYFNFWRGSLVFKVTFIKTKFHSGRVVIAFQPADGILLPAPTASTLAGTEFMYRNVIDIREKDEIYIEVPYVSLAPWLDTGPTGKVGKLSMHILDQLKAPSVVNSDITYFIEMYGGKDLAFSGPRNFAYKPLMTASLQSDTQVSAIRFPLTTIGDAEIPEKTSTYEEATIGEVIPSLRSIAKRGGFLLPDVVTAGLQDLILVIPTGNYWRRTTGTTVTEATNSCTIDPFSHFSAVYALSRGGVRIRSFETGGTNPTDNYAFGLDVVNSNAGAVTEVCNPQSTSVTDYITNNGITGNVVFNSSAPVSGVMIPQYTRTISRPSAANYANTALTFSYTDLETGPTQLRYTNFGNDTSISTLYHRAVADDGNFGCFVSICPHFNGLV